MAPGDARYHRPLNVFFDVDYTLLSWDNRLRPHVHDVFRQIVEDGHKIYIWSGMGIRREMVERNELTPYVSGVFRKPLENYRKVVHEYTPVRPDFVVDDHPEVVADFAGERCQPPRHPMDGDQEMWRIYEVFARYVRRLQERDGDASAD